MVSASVKDDVIWRRVFYVNVFFSCVSFSIVLPSIWPYLQALGSSEDFLALSVAIYSVGEAVGAVAFGAWSNKASTKLVMIILNIIGIVGSLLYSIALCGGSVFGPAMIFIGRFLQGLWTGGAQSAQMNHLAKVLANDSLTKMTVTMNAWACLGFVVGPAFGVLFAGQNKAFGPFVFNEITLPGYLCAALGLLILMCFVLFFENSSGACEVLRPETLDEEQPLLAENSRSPRALGAWMCNILFAVHFFGFALQETITTPVVQQFYGWNVFQANSLFTFSGVLSLMTFVVLSLMNGKFGDRALVLASTLTGIVGYAVMMDIPANYLPLWRFACGFGLVSIAFPISRAVVVAMYSKVLGPSDQGVWMGILFAAGALSRILGPFIAVRALMWGGPRLVFGVTSTLFAFCAALMIPTYAALRPYSEATEKY